MRLVIESTNMSSKDVYTEIELLGHMFTLAATDFKHIHLVVHGHSFQDVHRQMDSYYGYCSECADKCFELCLEGDVVPRHTSKSLEYVESWEIRDRDSYDYDNAYRLSQDIHTVLTDRIKEVRSLEGITPDIQSMLDEWLRELTQQVNYFVKQRIV